MKPIIRKISAIPFSVKIITVYVLTLLTVLTFISYQQIKVSVSVIYDDSESNLIKLTEQVATNFSSQHSSINNSIYSSMRAYSIPSLMYSHEHVEGSSLYSLRQSLSQSMFYKADYDYALLQLKDLNTVERFNSQLEQGYEKAISLFANELLEKYSQVEHALTEWVFDPNTGIYIIYDIYYTNPMRYTGRAIFHLRDDLLSISEENSNTGFIFCDNKWNIIAFDGMNMDYNERLELVANARNHDKTANGKYFVHSVKIDSSWTVGFMDMKLYNETRSNVIKVSIIYGMFGLVIGIGLMLLLTFSLNRKLRTIKKAMEAVAGGNFDYKAEIIGSDDISQIASTFNYTTNRIKELLDALVEKELEKKDIELQVLEYKYRSLETQIRPHFIYNALEIINSMAKLKGDKDTMDIVQIIGRYFRNITVTTTKQYIQVQQEFDALRDYTEIYKFIHGEKLKVTFSAKDKAKYALLPTMIIQPVVENALQHGLKGQEVVSEIIVHAYVSDNKLTITVKDSGYGLSDEQLYNLNNTKITNESKSHSGIGLGNVRERLNLLYGDEAHFTISNRSEGGAVVKVVMPLSYLESALSEEDEWDIDSI